MLYTKPKNNHVKFWITRLVQVALILGILFFGYEAINRFTTPQQQEPEEVQVIVLQPQVTVIEIYEVEVQQTTAIEPAPSLDAVDYHRLALEHHLANEFGEAILDYSRALNLDPSIYASWLNRGVAYEQLGDHYHAAQDFMRFVRREGVAVAMNPLVTSDTELRLNVLRDTAQVIPLSLDAGYVVNISATSVEDELVDTLIILADIDGNPLAANDDLRHQNGALITTSSEINSYHVQDTGNYFLIVTHAGGGEAGIHPGAVDVNIRIDG